ncbi:hypothetical protein LTR85_001178 [Meristemomyces frigidus]|nr:hypothetical protein LTR85_001178 [Meristemomyces frigidus]
MNTTGMRVALTNCDGICLYASLLHYEYYNYTVATLVDNTLPATALAATLCFLYCIMTIRSLTQHANIPERDNTTPRYFALFTLVTVSWMLLLAIIIVCTGYDHAFLSPWDNDCQPCDNPFRFLVSLSNSNLPLYTMPLHSLPQRRSGHPRCPTSRPSSAHRKWEVYHSLAAVYVAFATLLCAVGLTTGLLGGLGRIHFCLWLVYAAVYTVLCFQLLLPDGAIMRCRHEECRQTREQGARDGLDKTRNEQLVGNTKPRTTP